jgi:transposase-like protein
MGRFSSARKTDAVLRLLRGESLDALARELKVGAHKMSEWRDQFLEAGQTSFKVRGRTVEQDQVRRLKAKIGELTMDVECFEEIFKLRGYENPLHKRRSTP